jgi:hydrogenase maturation factor
MTDPDFVDEKMRLIIPARIVELYDSYGLAAFQFPGVQKAIDLLLDADEGIRIIQAQHTED